MALKSMTGYGRAEIEHHGRIWTVEIKSVNNRFLDAKIKLPRNYAALEDQIRKKIAGFHTRGRVDLVVSVSGDFSDLVKVGVDKNLARIYRDRLAELADELGIDTSPDLAMLINLPDVLTREQQLEDLEEIWPLLDRALDDGFGQCLEMRTREGAALAEDLGERLQLFIGLLDSIEENISRIIADRENSLKERLEKLLGAIDLDPIRLAQEVAVIVDKSDVTEEMVRLRSHIGQMQDLLESTEQVGRKLDFLIQEFLREVNTIASKINDAENAHKTVALKSELEKMREQVQNIE
ncbi:MAG: YicC family protein [Desulfofustis sp.]|nr:YicC family protein [Desulfofustis sp.]RZW25042.1 MAG: YicC family protein [Desulfobulbaceae bacterium]